MTKEMQDRRCRRTAKQRTQACSSKATAMAPSRRSQAAGLQQDGRGKQPSRASDADPARRSQAIGCDCARKETTLPQVPVTQDPEADAGPLISKRAEAARGSQATRCNRTGREHTPSQETGSAGPRSSPCAAAAHRSQAIACNRTGRERRPSQTHSAAAPP